MTFPVIRITSSSFGPSSAADRSPISHVVTQDMLQIGIRRIIISLHAYVFVISNSTCIASPEYWRYMLPAVCFCELRATSQCGLYCATLLRHTLQHWPWRTRRRLFTKDDVSCAQVPARARLSRTARTTLPHGPVSSSPGGPNQRTGLASALDAELIDSIA